MPRRFLCGALTLALLLSETGQAAAEYIVTDLGQWSSVAGINNAGQVVGSDQLGHGYLYSGGTKTDLGNFQPRAINDAGQVAGYSDYHAVLYSGGKMTDLGTLGGSSSVPSGINNAGQVVGYSATQAGMDHAFLYSGGKMTDLGTLGGFASYASGINGSGQVVGWTQAGVQHAFLYSGGKMTDLGTLGGAFSVASAINASGQVVGSATLASGATHIFLYSGGKMTDLGTLGGGNSNASGINAGGQVVGGASTAGETHYHPFLFSNGKMTDLNTLVAASSGWQLIDVSAINDRGQIVGRGLAPDDTLHALLLTPVDVPEPGTLTLLGVGAFGLATHAWRRRGRGARTRV